jgi:PAS domain S-box-containing protein
MRQGHRILLVEDEAAHIELVERAFRKQRPYDVIAACSSVTATLERIDQDVFDALVVDYSLPEASGLSLLEEVNRRGLHLPVIMVTGRGDEETAVQAMKLGAVDYIIKSGNYAQELPRAVHNAVEKRTLERQLADSQTRRSQELQTLYEVSQVLMSNLDLNQVFDQALNIIQESLGYVTCGICLIDEAANELYAVATRGYPDPTWNNLRIKVGQEGITGWVARHGEPLSVGDVTKDPRYICLDQTVRSEVAIPLKRGEKVIGVLDLESPQTDAFSEADVRLLSLFANQLAIAIENARLYDATQRALENAHQSREFFRQTIMQAPIAILITDARGTWLMANDKALELFGIADAGEILGRLNLFDQPTMLKEEAVSQVKAVLDGKVVQLTTTMDLSDARYTTTKEGRLTLRSTFFPLLDERRRVANIVVMIEDITDQKSLEQQLFEAQKMESIGQLASGIAHDFNNLLGAILGYASLVKTQLSMEHPHYKYISIIESSAERGADLTRQLLTFSRGGRFHLKPLNLNQTVSEVELLLTHTIDKRIVIRTDCDASLATMEGDAGQLQQMLLNLCLNARDAMPEGGDLIIETRNVYLDEHFARTHLGADVGWHLLLTVTDTGTGMDLETQRRIFEPFFTTKEEGKGTGLGLAMVYGVVKNHGGFVRVYSQLGQGTSFQIYLPSTEQRAVAAVPTVSSQTPQGTETILVVDDEAMIRQLLSDVLRQAGYKALVAGNGVEALRLLQQHRDEVALVVLDIVMPEMDGKATYDGIQAICPGLKVLVSSGYSQYTITRELMARPNLEFIQKPYVIHEVLTAVRQLLDQESVIG